MVRNGRRLFPWRGNCCLSVCARELCAVRAVPVIVWRRTRQPRFPPRKGAPRVASRDPPPLHGAARLAGAFFATVGTGARRFSARLHSARMLAHPSGSASPNLPSDASHLRRISANPPSSARGNPSAATARLAWSRSLPAPIASVPAASCPSRRRIRSGPVAGTPRPLRAIGTCPFLRGAFRAPYSEQSAFRAPYSEQSERVSS